MFTHSAMFTLTDDATVSVDRLCELLLALADDVPMCRAVSVAVNEDENAGASVLFLSEFDSIEDYQAYRTHEGHQRVLEALNGQLHPSVFVDHTAAPRRREGSSGRP